jgi:sulfur carrier protein
MSTSPFTVSLNGRPCHTSAVHLLALLEQQGYDLRAAFACAVNQAFVPRSCWGSTTLQPEDRVDVVTPVTGG